jgi:hypothetical protein
MESVMGKYTAAQRDAIYRWRHASDANQEKHRLTVHRANVKKIEEAREIISGIVYGCVVPGCPNDDLEFHHKDGSGKKQGGQLGSRATATIARWICQHPDEARKTIELRCFKHHREADIALGLFRGRPKGFISQSRKLTREQVITMRAAYQKGVKGHTLSALSKKYKIDDCAVWRIILRRTYKEI